MDGAKKCFFGSDRSPRRGDVVRVFVDLIDIIVVRIIKFERVSQYAASEKGTCFVSAL